MEYRHLKERSYYEDLYDRFTVEEGRRIEKYIVPEEIGLKKMKVTANVATWSGALVEIHIYFFRGERYKDKSDTINRWMQRDKEYDEHYDRVNMTRKCGNCSQEMKLINKMLHIAYEKGKQDYVEFAFRCHDCDYGMRIDEFGKERIITPSRCPECNSKLKCDIQEGKKKTVYQESCIKCTWVDPKPLSFDNFTKKEKIDRNYEQDKARFCLSVEEGNEYLASLRRIDELNEMMGKLKSDPKNKEGTPEYIVEHLERPTVAQLQSKLAKALKKNGFDKLKFSDADEVRADVIVEFRIQDIDEKRDAFLSKKLLKKTVENALLYSNWRLAPTSLSYRMGVLKGRLKGTDLISDLLELVKKRDLENKPLPESLKRPSMVNSKGEKIIF